MDQAVINFAIYEDSNEYCGLASVTLPDLTALTQTVSGAGIAGNIEAPILGHIDAMTLTLNFRTVTEQTVRLSEPRRHNIDLRVAQQALQGFALYTVPAEDLELADSLGLQPGAITVTEQGLNVAIVNKDGTPPAP